MVVKRLFVSCLFVCAMTTLGCGEKESALSPAGGTVTYQDKPLADATVQFVYEKGPQAMGTTDATGKFTMNTNGRAGAPLGKAKVSITKANKDANTKDMTSMKPEDMMQMAKDSTGGKMPVPKSAIPEKYADPNLSTFSAEVVSGGADKNTFTFTLSD